MAKTLEAISGRKYKVEMVVSAAMVTALASLTTAETIDLSSITKSVSGGGLTRAVNKEFVTGDDTAISDYDTRLERGDLVFNFLYTNGKETLGTDNLDPYAIFKELAEYTTTDLSVQFILSPAGGAAGDDEFTTDADESFIVGLSDPVGGVDTNGKVQFTLTLSTPTLTQATV